MPGRAVRRLGYRFAAPAARAFGGTTSTGWSANSSTIRVCLPTQGPPTSALLATSDHHDVGRPGPGLLEDLVGGLALELEGLDVHPCLGGQPGRVAEQ